jgi:hypothetical protein
MTRVKQLYSRTVRKLGRSSNWKYERETELIALPPCSWPKSKFSYDMQQCLNFFPLPQGQGSFLPVLVEVLEAMFPNILLRL